MEPTEKSRIKDGCPVDFFYDLYPEIRDGLYGDMFGVGYYWIAYIEGGKTIKVEYRALSLNEAIGAFLADNADMTYNDIFDHFEV